MNAEVVKIKWKVGGMTCTNCALSISKYLNKQGLQNVSVNAIDGSVSFNADYDTDNKTLKKGIEKLGYEVLDNAVINKKRLLDTPFKKFLFCLPFTLVLMLHMLPVHIHWLMNGWVQMVICLPVLIIGMNYFGINAVKSISSGVPNMNVLIALGAAAAFIYSLSGTIFNLGENYLYYESCTTIITLVFLGYWMEDKAIQTTQRSLNLLAAEQKSMANMIAFDDKYQEHIFPVESRHLKSGDLILIKSGEHVPADSKILSGSGMLNEALFTGESLPVKKDAKDLLIGGSVLEDGLIKAQVTATSDDSILSKIIYLAKQAQAEKPKLQQLADRISAVFVPAVLMLSFITILTNYFIADVNFSNALMRGIAVLVIACPCAMGLATPAAIAVGLGRGATNGIIFKDAKSLELFKDIRQVVFDKTGTLTNGKFIISDFGFEKISEEEFRNICFSMEKISNHPIAKCISAAWKTTNAIRWKSIKEIKGSGIEAMDTNGNIFLLGSSTFTGQQSDNHHLILTRNNELLGWIDVRDDIRGEAKDVVKYFEQRGITTYLLSGDKYDKCKMIANELGIKHVYAEQSPRQKMEVVANLNSKAPTAMVGDEINDAADLAKATIGISLSEASGIAVQNAQVVLINNGLKKLPFSLSLGKQTFNTIRQNLFWAFIYNVVAIPVAAFGLLTPGFAALAMGFSDVVLAANSVRLRWKKLV